MTYCWDKMGVLRYQLPPDFQSEVREYLHLLGEMMKYDTGLGDLAVDHFMQEIYEVPEGTLIADMILSYADVFTEHDYESSVYVWVFSRLHDWDHGHPGEPHYGHYVEKFLYRQSLSSGIDDPDARKYFAKMRKRIIEICNHDSLWNRINQNHPAHDFTGKYLGMCTVCQEFQRK